MTISAWKLTTAALAATLAVSIGAPALADGMATTESVVNHHLEAFGAGDVDAMLSDYTAESVMFTQGGNLTGPDELKPAFEGLIAEFSKPGMVFEMQLMSVVGDVAYIVWNAETADNVYEIATDTFVVRDGKIIVQTFTVKSTSKN